MDCSSARICFALSTTDMMLLGCNVVPSWLPVDYVD
jgi:hypothetical protein